MSQRIVTFNRRTLIKGMTYSAALFSVPGLFAEELVKTPSMTAGPFYPDKLPLDTDNDLLRINDAITPAVGKVTHLSGRILDAKGKPIRNATVEIWQVDNNGSYLHPHSDNREKRDKNFQGYGRFLTNAKGEYYFRTVKPVAYPGRTPHIHFAVNHRGRQQLTTQMLIKGDRRNKGDGLFRAIKGERQRQALLAEFKPMKDSKVGELQAKFDLVVGVTPDERMLKQKQREEKSDGASK